EAPYVPEDFKRSFYSLTLPYLFEKLQQDLIQHDWRLSQISVYNRDLYERYKDSERLFPYLTQPVISEVAAAQKTAENRLHEMKEAYVSYSLNPQTKMFDVSQITDTTLLYDDNFIDALALIMNKMPGEILDTLLNQ
ncbi:hypothetical protein ACUOFC_37380, partial [Escherichia sp. TWPC-MK]